MNNANPLVIIDYRPEWPEEFEAVTLPVRKALGTLALRVDHIGSTAVPGLAAKDIIDVQVTVRDFTSGLEAAFRHAGYSRLEFNQDHRPPTATGPHCDWEK